MKERYSMNTRVKIGCVSCEGGEIFHYYKNEARQKIRCDFTYCYHCYPTATATTHAYPGEEVIDVAEFTELDAKGWGTDDIWHDAFCVVSFLYLNYASIFLWRLAFLILASVAWLRLRR